jgi:flagellar hook-associated protein 3 FlgL
MRITTSMVQRNILADLNTLQSKLAKTQTKAASGKEITRPSDDPFQASRAIGLRAELGANRQFVRNIEDSQGWLDTTESALASITDYVNRAHDLLVRAASDTSDPTSRIAIAAEIDQIIQGIKESANATYGDRYVLSGTATTAPPSPSTSRPTVLIVTVTPGPISRTMPAIAGSQPASSPW